MNCDERQQWAALAALGALDGPELGALRERLAADADARAELARFMDVAAAMAGALVGPGAGSEPAPRPSGEVRARVLERIRRTPQRKAGESAEADLPEIPAGIRFVRAEEPWMPGPIPGTKLKVLSMGPRQGYAMILVDLPAGTIYPEHDHEGAEEMYILSGDLESEGRRLGPGDFLHAEAGSHHHELRSPGGCMALMVVPASSLPPMPLPMPLPAAVPAL